VLAHLMQHLHGCSRGHSCSIKYGAPPTTLLSILSIPTSTALRAKLEPDPTRLGIS